MIILNQLEQIRSQVRQWKQEGSSIAFVPTMGNLHEGHLTLVREAKKAADKVVVSIFVNPTQFDHQEDLAAYPRTFDQDKASLEKEFVDVIFFPDAKHIYPNLQTSSYITVPDIINKLEGLSRSGHFEGVATIVCKLFNLVNPDIALFGEKDFQQLMLIKRMVADLNMDIDVRGIPTVRESDGLAMSSRNGYLTTGERQVASILQSTLSNVVADIKSGKRNYQTLQAQAIHVLEQGGFRPDYLEIRRKQDLEIPEESDRELVLLAAAWLGKARLLDNIPFTLKR